VTRFASRAGKSVLAVIKATNVEFEDATGDSAASFDGLTGVGDIEVLRRTLETAPVDVFVSGARRRGGSLAGLLHENQRSVHLFDLAIEEEEEEEEEEDSEDEEEDADDDAKTLGDDANGDREAANESD